MIQYDKKGLLTYDLQNYICQTSEVIEVPFDSAGRNLFEMAHTILMKFSTYDTWFVCRTFSRNFHSYNLELAKSTTQQTFKISLNKITCKNTTSH